MIWYGIYLFNEWINPNSLNNQYQPLIYKIVAYRNNEFIYLYNEFIVCMILTGSYNEFIDPDRIIQYIQWIHCMILRSYNEFIVSIVDEEA